MKMENSIKAPADETIKAVKITAGNKVEKNQVMILLA
jgi:biotin carboxyl carrier protein